MNIFTFLHSFLLKSKQISSIPPKVIYHLLSKIPLLSPYRETVQGLHFRRLLAESAEMTRGGRTFKNPYFKKSRNETVIKHAAMQKV